MGLSYTWCHFTRVKVRPKRARALLTQKTIFFFFLLIIFFIFVVGPPISKKAFTTKAPKKQCVIGEGKAKVLFGNHFCFLFSKTYFGEYKEK